MMPSVRTERFVIRLRNSLPKSKDKKRAPEQKDNRAESLLESNGRQQYKPLGKIDLDNIGKKPAAESVAESLRLLPSVLSRRKTLLRLSKEGTEATTGFSA